MKKHLLLIIAAFSFLGTFAQTISVKSFQALPTDMTAGSLEGKRIDQNNEVCALIKIVTTQTGFTFEAGALGIVDTKQEAGEVWVWVPRGSRKITIKHPQLGVLREYRYPVEIEAERTYEMVLVTGTVETIVKEEVQEQYLMFEVVPAEAILEVNDQMWSISAEGTARKMVAFGTYTYRAQAPNYHPEAGNVTVNDPDNTKKVKIVLKPNFGWIEVPGTGVLQDAVVYIDNALIGKAPCKSDALKSGTHNIKIQKNLYVSYNATVTVNDNETTTVSPNLTADFARVTLQVDTDAEIWVNDEKKGVRTWTGELESGTYKIECKLANHEPSTVRKEITNQMNGEVIRLDTPRPIYGSLNVESTPDMATLYIDGKEIGETPKLIKEILIGQHEIRLTKQNYNDFATTVTIKKGERALVEASMDDVKYEQLAKQGDDYYKNMDYEKALQCYRQAADHGDPAGQTGIGIMYVNGRTMEKDYEEAIKWFQKAADQGYAEAENWIGALYFRGQGVPKDEVVAATWFRKAADKGLAKAQSWLGYVYRNGKGVGKDYEEAIKWYRKAAEQDYTPALQNLGEMYKEGYGVAQDYAEATRCMVKAGELGDASAYSTLAEWYQTGSNFTKDETEANKWYRKAEETYIVKAEQSSSEAYNLGKRYKEGKGVQQDYEKAITWYRKAAEQNYTRAWRDLGEMFREGKIVTKNYTEAARCMAKAGELGDALAYSRLAEWYQTGLNFTKDETEANKWYGKAAEIYRAKADQSGYDAFQLGKMYKEGNGVQQDYTEAMKWYTQALGLGYENVLESASMEVALGYLLGRGVKKDEKRGEQLLREKGDKEYIKACLEIGHSFMLGQHGTLGLPKDDKEALKWYKKAVDLGSAEAMYQIGQLYGTFGKGDFENSAEAAKWYMKADQAGDPHARRYLGHLYYFGGKGLEKDYEKAMYWYRKDVELGSIYSKSSQYDIGKMYEKGEGVAKNITEAKKWYKMAADKGYDKAIEALNRLK